MGLEQAEHQFARLLTDKGAECGSGVILRLADSCSNGYNNPIGYRRHRRHPFKIKSELAAR